MAQVRSEVLVGRGRELTRLSDALLAARDRRGGVVVPGEWRAGTRAIPLELFRLPE